MTIDDLKSQNLILLECISGSRAYGLDTPDSDLDIKGVFYLPKSHYYRLPNTYIPQINNETNDIVYYEIGRFIELLLKNNPSIMELLNTPKNKIIYKHPIMDVIDPKDFISKLCQKTFLGFAANQIKKSHGLNKRIVNPMDKTKKSVLDFCYILKNGDTILLNTWLTQNQLTQNQLGLAQINHVAQLYAVYIDKENRYQFSGVVQKSTANNLSLSSIPKNLPISSYLYFNQIGYSKYCQDYHDYWQWVKNHNNQRYQTTLKHDQPYDTKNMMHNLRLLHMAKEIATDGQIRVKRPNKDELLLIKSGHYQYEELILMVDNLQKDINDAFSKSDLPEMPNTHNAMNALEKIRLALYG